MKKKEVLLDFMGSLGAVLLAVIGIYYFGQIASDVGKVFLYILGFAIFLISLPGIASVRLLRGNKSSRQTSEHSQTVQEDAPTPTREESEEALTAAQVIQMEDVRASTLVELASRLAELGYSEEALAVVREIQLERGQTSALAKLAPNLSESLLVETLIAYLLKKWQYSKDLLEIDKDKATLLRILLVRANPTEITLFRLNEESRAIEQAMTKAQLRTKFEITECRATSISDLQRHLLFHKPDIIHFTGHGSQANEIILEDNFGSISPVSSEALSRLFSGLRGNTRLVLLDACYSALQAQTITEHVDAVIGISTKIRDSAAISFASTFYQTLAYGKNLKTAFELGKLAITLENADEENTPELLTTGGNPEETIFVSS